MLIIILLLDQQCGRLIEVRRELLELTGPETPASYAIVDACDHLDGALSHLVNGEYPQSSASNSVDASSVKTMSTTVWRIASVS